MNKTLTERALHRSIAELETHLETPIIPGELPSWLSTLSDLFSRLRKHLHHQINHIHEEHFSKIADEDAALLRRIEQMQAEDTAIARECRQYSQRLQDVHEQARRVEPDEAQLDQTVQQLIDDGLELVIRMRKQETAITTWMLEAFNRDRGIAD